MDEKQVLELMRDVFMCDASWNVGLIAEINRRLAALTVERRDLDRNLRDAICVRTANACYAAGIYTFDDLAEMTERDLLSKKNFGHRTIDEIRKALADRGMWLHGEAPALPAAAQADGEEPTVEECYDRFTDFSMGALEDPRVSHNEAYKCGVAAVRSLMLRTRPAPSHALVDALDAARSFVQDVLNSPSAWCGDHKLHTSQHGEAELKYILGLLDAARSSLPAAKKEGGE